jgi:hypothetical protein
MVSLLKKKSNVILNPLSNMIDYFRFVMLNNVFGAGVWHFDQTLLNGGA